MVDRLGRPGARTRRSPVLPGRSSLPSAMLFLADPVRAATDHVLSRYGPRRADTRSRACAGESFAMLPGWPPPDEVIFAAISESADLIVVIWSRCCLSLSWASSLNVLPKHTLNSLGPSGTRTDHWKCDENQLKILTKSIWNPMEIHQKSSGSHSQT